MAPDAEEVVLAVTSVLMNHLNPEASISACDPVAFGAPEPRRWRRASFMPCLRIWRSVKGTSASAPEATDSNASPARTKACRRGMSIILRPVCRQPGCLTRLP